MRPAASNFNRYFSIASLSEREILYIFLVGSVVLGSKSMTVQGSEEEGTGISLS